MDNNNTSIFIHCSLLICLLWTGYLRSTFKTTKELKNLKWSTQIFSLC